MKLTGKLKQEVDKIDTKEGKRDAIRKAGKKLTDDELEQISGGCEEDYSLGYYYIIFYDPYEKVGPFDTMGQADDYLRGISGRHFDIIVDF